MIRSKSTFPGLIATAAIIAASALLYSGLREARAEGEIPACFGVLAAVIAVIVISLMLMASFRFTINGLFPLISSFAGGAASIFLFSILFDSLTPAVLAFTAAAAVFTLDQGIVILAGIGGPGSAADPCTASRPFDFFAAAAAAAPFGIMGLCNSDFSICGLGAAITVAFSFLISRALCGRVHSAPVPDADGASPFLVKTARFMGRDTSLVRLIVPLGIPVLLLSSLAARRYAVWDGVEFLAGHGAASAALTGAVLAVLLLLMHADIALAAISLLTAVYAFFCAAAFSVIAGVPPDTAVAVTAAASGIGASYAIHIIKSYQRRTPGSVEAAAGPAVLIASACAAAGSAALALAPDAGLRDIGTSLFAAVVFSATGAYAVLPPVLGRVFVPAAIPAGVDPFAGIMRRLRHREAHPRLFAYFKMRTDPMFGELERMTGSPSVVIDIGTGFGIPAMWLAELFPNASVYGIEPDRRRALFADMMLAGRGSVATGAAPDLPVVPGKADTALMLDMIHHLDDGALRLTLERIRRKLVPGGRLVIRTTIPAGRRTFLRTVEEIRLKLSRARPVYREVGVLTALMKNSGFGNVSSVISGTGREEFWFTAEAGLP